MLNILRLNNLLHNDLPILPERMMIKNVVSLFVIFMIKITMLRT